MEVNPFKCDAITIREVHLPMRQPFVTANGTETSRRLILVEVHAGETVGYGEAPPLSAPFYTEETPETVWYVLCEFLIPLALGKVWSHPCELATAMRPIRRHFMAKAGLEGAFWDVYAKRQGVALAH